MQKILLFITTLFYSVIIIAQVNISGTVFDEAGVALPGANVIEKGTNNGTITDINGKFSLSVDGPESILFISFIGYQSQDIVVGSKTVFKITLEAELKKLDEVVVIGYGTIKKKDLTGSVASVNSSQIKDVPVTDISQAITGRLGGVQITTSEGSPDAEVTIRVRGGGSITQDNSPLIIIDGFPANNISDVAASDIESIDVLKDASSAAIYGSRGANGVIIITTKRGQAGKLKVDYNFYTGYKELTKKYSVLSPDEYVLYQFERAQNSLLEARDFKNIFGEYVKFDSLYGSITPIDWQQEVFGNKAVTKYHHFNFTGGNEKSAYNVSLSRNDDQGIMLGSGFIRNNISMRYDFKPLDKIKISTDVRYSDVEVTGAGTSDPGTSTTNNLKHSIIYRPFQISVQNPNIDFSEEDYYQQSEITDPVSLVEDDYRQKSRKIGTYNGSFSYEIFEGLSVKTELGLEARAERTDRFYGLATSYARKYGEKPAVTILNETDEVLRWANTLNYIKTDFKDMHDFNILLGQELIQSKGRNIEMESRSFPVDISPNSAIENMTFGELPQANVTSKSEDRLLSYFGRLMYNYKEILLTSFTLRADGSTKFKPGPNQWGIFPSGSAALRISEMDFMNNLSKVSNLKIRISYGQAGNNRIDNFLYTQTFRIDDNNGYFLNENELPYFRQSDPLANPEIKWETTVTKNMGFDVGIFDNRLNTTIELYRNDAIDLLLEEKIPNISGYEAQIRNIGSTSNSGVEFLIDAYIIDRKDFKLSVNFNIAFNKSRVEDLGGTESYLVNSGWNNNIGSDYIVKEGEPVGLMYGFVTDGFYTVDDFIYDPVTETYTLKYGVADNEDLLFAGFGPGSVKFKDINSPLDSVGNIIDDSCKVTTEDDRVIIGNANPKHTGGLNISMSYKWIDFSVFMNWVYGNDIYNANLIEFSGAPKLYTNLLDIMAYDKRWKTIDENGQVVTDPDALKELNKDAVIWKPQPGRVLFHSWAVEDGSFLRINNITLGITAPKKWTQKIHIQKIRFYTTVYNAFLFTNYSGYDPEVNTRRRTPLTPGVDYSAYPRSRSFIFGLNLTL